MLFRMTFIWQTYIYTITSKRTDWYTNCLMYVMLTGVNHISQVSE